MSKPKRVNRKLTCVVTQKEVLVKPDKYEKLIDRWDGDVEKNFVCFEVEKAVRSNDTAFWIANSKVIRTIKESLQEVLIDFNSGPKDQTALLKLQNELTAICSKELKTIKFEIVPTSDRLNVKSLIVRDIAIIGEIIIELT